MWLKFYCFFDLNVNSNNGESTTTSFYIKPTNRHQYLLISHLIRTILKGQLFIVNLYGQVVYVHLKKIL